MSLSLFPQLPQELVDIVVRSLKDDVTSLRSCTLISRSWSAVSRAHLFHSISAETSQSISSFAALIDTSPSVGLLVRNIVLGHNPSHCDHNPLSEISLHTLALLLLKLPNLQTLHLSFLDFSTNSNSSTPAKLPSPVSLGLLELNYLKPRDIKQLFTVFQFFAKVETFQIENSFVVPFAGNYESSLEQAATWGEDDDEDTALHPLEVESLQIRFSRYGVDRFMRWFAKSPSRFVVVEKVSSLNMELPLCLNKGFAANLIQIFGPGVSKFDLDLTKQRFGNVICQISQSLWLTVVARMVLAKDVNTDFLQIMGSFEQLECLSLTIMLDSNKPHICLRTWEYIVDLLKSLIVSTKMTLRHFKLIWNFVGTNSERPILSNIGWTNFEAALLAFESLTTVEFFWGSERLEAEEPVSEPPLLSVYTLLWKRGRQTVGEMLPELFSKEILIFSREVTCT